MNNGLKMIIGRIEFCIYLIIFYAETIQMNLELLMKSMKDYKRFLEVQYLRRQ